jgi:glycosyltransferase involved in cell wall biosynthesis
MSEPLFSIVVATHDRSELLAECLASIQAQTISDFECIVVDDASSPPAVVPDDPRFRLVRKDQSERRPSTVRNVGLRAATGRYLTLTDDDDLFTPNRLELGLRGVERADVGLCWVGSVGAVGFVRDSFYDYGWVYDTALNTEAHFVGTITLATANAPEFDERLVSAEDKEWWLRLAERFTVHTIPEVGVLHREHGGARVSGNLEGRERDREVILDKHRAYFDAHPRAEAKLWHNIAWLALHLNRPILAARYVGRALKADPSLTGLVEILRRLHPFRQIWMKARGSFRKRIMHKDAD